MAFKLEHIKNQKSCVIVLCATHLNWEGVAHETTFSYIVKFWPSDRALYTIMLCSK